MQSGNRCRGKTRVVNPIAGAHYSLRSQRVGDTEARPEIGARLADVSGLRIVRITHFGLCELCVLVAKAVVESEVLRNVKFVLAVEIEIANENPGQERSESLAIRLPTFTAVTV